MGVSVRRCCAHAGHDLAVDLAVRRITSPFPRPAAAEVERMIGQMSTADASLAPTQPARRPDNASVFTPNMSLPIHRWFRYSAGFSAAWVEHAVAEAGGRPRVFDPFAGSGTTLLGSRAVGAPSKGVETHPLIARVARAKLLAATVDPVEFARRAAAVLAAATPTEWVDPPALMAKIYPPNTLATLVGLRDAGDRLREGDDVDELIWLAIVGILRACSPVGTAQWQYVLPNKSKAKAADPVDAYRAQVAMMAFDIDDVAGTGVSGDARAELFEEDARKAPSIPDDWADLVITSPPYPNNYDYADATRIEMTFLGEIASWGDLQGAVRSRLVRSCSQHMVRYDALPVLASGDVEPIRDELTDVYRRLAVERELHGGKKNYHSMVVAYFADLAQTWQTLRRICAPGAEVLFIIGDSAPYGVHVPVERWLGELALAAGFVDFDFTKLRDRNTKWKNRKHRVPLQEGLLRVKG
jgi:hypothetical protein